MMRAKLTCLALAMLAVAGCATQPTGPTVRVMPAPNKPFEVFRDDDAICRNFAAQETAGGAEAANRQAVGAAALGTVLGAGLGAAVGDGRGAAAGAAGGAVVGTAVGSSKAERGEMSLQRRYDIAYEQCMYSRGNQVPGYYAPPNAAVPPPPPGAQPTR
jgi:uncharacterized protein YcfJ